MINEFTAHFAQKVVAVITPWLVVAVVVLLILWLVLFCRQTRLFAKPFSPFIRLPPFGKLVETQRSFFQTHAFMGVYDGRIFDACVGPALGTLQINDYMRSVIDYSTENERRLSRYWDGNQIEVSQPAQNYKLK